MAFDFSKITKRFTGGNRPPFEKYYFTILILFVAYLVADVSTLYVRQYLLPQNPPPRKIAPPDQMQRNYTFTEIIPQNIFNADKKIPPSLGEVEGGGGPADGAPRLSQLPLELLGTIVHADPTRSLATIVLKGQNKVEPFRVAEKIMDLAEIKEIQREKIIFRNLRTQILEYIEVPKDERIVINTQRGASLPGPAPKTTADQTDFTFPRAEIDKKLENLQELLQAARVVPEIGPDSRVVGYRMVELQPGSMFEKMGMKLGDVIEEVNGVAVTNAQQALELYQTMKSENNFKVKIKRNGTSVDMNYTLQ